MFRHGVRMLLQYLPRLSPSAHSTTTTIRLLSFLAIAVFYFVILNARPDLTRFDCHDSESYLALSHSLFHGRGYTRSMDPANYIGHKWWPPGVPILLLPAVAASGETINWVAVKSTTVAVGLTGVLLTWFLVRRLTSTTSAADLASLLIAFNPYYWHFSHQALAEIFLVTWIIGGLLLVDVVWAGRTVRFDGALLTGLVCGLGMMIKGTAVCLAFAPAAYCWNPRQSLTRPRWLVVMWAVFCFGFAIPQLGWMARNSLVDGPPPPSLDRGNQLMLARIPGRGAPDRRATSELLPTLVYNVRTYGIYDLSSQTIPGLWPETTLDFPGSGYVAAPLVLTVILLAFPWRGRLLSLHTVLLPAALLPLQIGGLGYCSRYMFPVSFILVIILGIQLSRVMDRLPAQRGKVAAVLIAILALNLGSYVYRHESNPYNEGGPWQELVQLFDEISNQHVRTEGVLTPNPHMLQLMSGRPAPMVSTQSNGVYEHMVARVDGAQPEAPAHSRAVITVYPWSLFSLPRPMSAKELIDVRRCPNGIPVHPYNPENRSIVGWGPLPGVTVDSGPAPLVCAGAPVEGRHGRTRAEGGNAARTAESPPSPVGTPAHFVPVDELPYSREPATPRHPHPERLLREHPDEFPVFGEFPGRRGWGLRDRRVRLYVNRTTRGRPPGTIRIDLGRMLTREVVK